MATGQATGDISQIRATPSADRKTVSWQLGPTMGLCGVLVTQNGVSRWVVSCITGPSNTPSYTDQNPMDTVTIVAFTGGQGVQFPEGSECGSTAFAVGYDQIHGFGGDTASQQSIGVQTTPSTGDPTAFTQLVVQPQAGRLVCVVSVTLKGGTSPSASVNPNSVTVTASDSNPIVSYFVTAETTPVSRDVVAPDQLTGLTGSVQSDGVHLGWNPSAASDLYEYHLYRNGSFLADVKSAAAYIDTTTQAGMTYQYDVTAVDTGANESLHSASVTVTVPSVSPPRVCLTGTHGTPPTCVPDSCPSGTHLSATQCVVNCPVGQVGTTPPNCVLRDSDGDGIPDTQDACPAAPGPSSNNGCPLPAAPKPRCIVPKLNGKTLKQAKRMLMRANCKLGKVTKPRHIPPHSRLRVGKQKATATTHRPAGYRVNLTLVASRK